MAAGIGNWERFCQSPFTLHDVCAAASYWKRDLQDIERPWLCWNVDDEWCLVQQQMVLEVGWTPLVGFDPRVGMPPLVPGARAIDFNAPFGFSTMYPHFPLEFAFAFAERLAFWHSDLLVPLERMKAYARRFEAISDEEIIATEPALPWRNRIIGPRIRRAWELLGCVSKGGSLSNFEKGCGWWMCFYLHPNCQGHDERRKRMREYWDHGTGVLYWRDHCDGNLSMIPEAELDPGHFTRIRRRDTYKVTGHDDWRRDLSSELSANFSLAKACEAMGLKKIYEQAMTHRRSRPEMLT
ncbi:MAG: hypothetical protein H7346_12530 [Burkholderiaceae bacterium]|nr:hypothetical protein [Burkholderiaceae bacterium]